MSTDKFLRSIGIKVSKTSFSVNTRAAINEVMKTLSVGQSISLDPFKYEIGVVKQAVYRFRKDNNDNEKKFSIRFRSCQNQILITRVR